MKRHIPTAIDLYSGIGGWTLGLKMAGIKVIASYEWWDNAIETHNRNFGTKVDQVDIRKLPLEQLPAPGSVDFVVGSPPCTQFSFANRGGSGDIADGLKDIHKFLSIVEYLEPRYWVMENVPRVASILERELGDGGQLSQFANSFSTIAVEDMSQFGLPQSRKRMLAGRYPDQLLQTYKSRAKKLTLGTILKTLNRKTIEDPLFGIRLPRNAVTDLDLEPALTGEEVRMNREAKTHHHIYNTMQFPDCLNRPSRTVTATCTRVSRESIIVPDNKIPAAYRRLSPRERATIQSFPITYQFYANSYAAKLKMIGNAFPPLMAYQLGNAMREIPASRYKFLKERKRQHKASDVLPVFIEPERAGRTYPIKRSFRFAIPELRLHSGTRFELKNHFVEENVFWQVGFYYGSSKEIKSVELDHALYNRTLEFLDIKTRRIIEATFSGASTRFNGQDSSILQSAWNHSTSGPGPFELVDVLKETTIEIRPLIASHELDEITQFVLNETSKRVGTKKLTSNAATILTGFIVGGWFNSQCKFNTKNKLGSKL